MPRRDAMAARVARRPEAIRDLVRHANYLGRNSLSVATRFLAAAERTFENLARVPTVGGLYEFATPPPHPFRVFPIKKFPNHLVFYLALSDGIEVVRVLHAAQDKLGRTSCSE